MDSDAGATRSADHLIGIGIGIGNDRSDDEDPVVAVAAPLSHEKKRREGNWFGNWQARFTTH
jgi:hypothetical protein